MKRKAARKSVSTGRRVRFNSAEFLLLLLVVLAFLIYFGMQNGLLPQFFSDSILGVATIG